MIILTSSAEHFAEAATKLPSFRNMNLNGVKDRVAEILALIGRVDGIFSTYTKHDISHIDAMLKMLDWLIPPITRERLTSTDWLLLVLAIYLHDLGMVVTSDEYQDRAQNAEFLAFLDKLENDPDGKDYWARAQLMDDEEKNRFFYQEFVRLHHATRIREWITGNHSRFWGDKVKAFSDEINEIMVSLPPRFRESLGIVCESHHKDNLENIKLYPLAQRYGNDIEEIANVQYAALLLRTVDLIHVTRDRTPSVMYKAIKFSDLKSIDEWDKQMGTFSVHMKSREFDLKDTGSHIIEVDADFTEERPFFALTEYLSYADSQIKQTKQWADLSQQNPDAKHFYFPWRAIHGDIRVEGNLPHQMRFELDRGRLLNLLVGHTIYNDPTVAVRELLQNSIDALRFQAYLDNKDAKNTNEASPVIGKVLVKWNPANRELVIEDTGIGMDLNIIENHLLRVGSSFYDSPRFQTENADFTPISRFGIGILTCFMISDNIEIITCRAGIGRRIRMSSVHADYLLKDLKPGDLQLDSIEPHGTKVRLILRPSVDLTKRNIIDILRQWVILPACEVLYSEDGAEAQKIGFESAGAALRHKFEAEHHLTFADEDYEVVTVQPAVDDVAEYELAFMVSRGYSSERSLVGSDKKPTAAVCIEGIRADWNLPGFSSGLCAILSVRNNKKFRTTVSRQSLEIDDEYRKIAAMCATALFNHVRSEVDRIAALNGNPLLQASSAGRWVMNSLTRHSTAATRETLQSLYSSLPLVVMETVTNEREASTRRLSSIKEINSMSSFWTIESRAVDYLGIISRDLGRELNINNFLSTLTPDFYDSRVTPILVDPEAFKSDLFASHRVAEVDFSRKLQRTLLKWEPVGELSKDFRNQLDDLLIDEVDLTASRIGFNVNDYSGVRGISRFLVGRYSWPKCATAKIKGDIAEVHGVKTRIVIILQKDSLAGKVWEQLNEALVSDNINRLTVSERAHLVNCIVMVERSRNSGASRSRRDWNRDLIGPWRAVEPIVNTALRKMDISFVVPSDLETLLGDDSQWFDASWFWRDWN